MANRTEAPDLRTTYLQHLSEVLDALRADVDRGLSGEEARARLEQYGRNELTAEAPPPSWRRFLAQFQDVLVLLLLAATAVSAALWAFERDAALPYEAIAILGVVLLNATMGYVQEARAEAVVTALRAMSRAARRRALDLGCGVGRNALPLAALGWNVSLN